ncbi:MAG: glycosyltransferase [Panacibacter sp.]
MNFLIIADTVPFPPLNGKELPAAKLFEQLSKKYKVDLLVLSSDKTTDEKRANKIPENISLINIIPFKRKSRKTRLLQTFAGAANAGSFNWPDAIIAQTLSGRHYDWLWVYPVTFIEFIEHAKKMQLNFYSKVAVGLNDSLTYLYRDSINELICSRQIKKRYITDWLMSFSIASMEKRLLQNVDLVHVQTEVEKIKLQKLLPKTSGASIVVAPNGVKKELCRCSYKGAQSNLILFMTHLDGGRVDESEWFCKKVWPLIIKKIPEARLLIAGKPPVRQLRYIEKYSSIIVNGYADNLEELFNSVRITVVPTFHGTGLINRILDALTAGVPAVSTPQAAATFPGLVPGKHILSAQDPQLFADHVTALYHDENYAKQIAANGRDYANAFPGWPQFIEILEQSFTKEIY